MKNLPYLLREFVEKIVVHECSYDENKTRRQDIEIYYFLLARWTCPNNRPTYPTIRAKCRIGTAKFYTSITSLSHISKYSYHQSQHGHTPQELHARKDRLQQ